MIFYLQESILGPGTHAVSVHGELDMHAAPELRAVIDSALAEGGVGRLVVDLSDVAFIDSAGIAVLVAAYKRLRELNGSLEVVCSEPNVLRILDLAGLDRLLSIRREPEVARASV